MDRLTEPTIGCFLYRLKDHKAVPGEFGTYEAFFDYSMAVRKLGQYEETGLTPEEVLSMRMNMAIINAMFQHAEVERMKELAEADRDGRVRILPKSGDATCGDGCAEDEDDLESIRKTIIENDAALKSRDKGRGIDDD